MGLSIQRISRNALGGVYKYINKGNQSHVRVYLVDRIIILSHMSGSIYVAG